MTTTVNYDVLKHQIDTLQREGRGLTDWEQNFLRSVVGQFKAKGWLSPKQAEIVGRIYAEKTPTGSPFGNSGDEQSINYNDVFHPGEDEVPDTLDSLPSTRRNRQQLREDKYGRPEDI